jgi:hypothetical protein
MYCLEDPLNAVFSSEPLTNTSWTGTSLSLLEFQDEKLTATLEKAICSAHTHKNNNPSLTILILSDWKHTPYFARNLHTAYVKNCHSTTYTHQKPTPVLKYNLHVYLVANSKALSQV